MFEVRSVQGKNENSLDSKAGLRIHSATSPPLASSIPEYIVSAVVLSRCALVSRKLFPLAKDV